MQLSDSVEIPRARGVITHARQVGVDSSGLPVYKVLDVVESFNLLTDGGRVAAHTYIYGTPAQRTAAGLGTGLNYIALSNNGAAALAGDTILTGELTTDGLGRALGSVTLPTGSSNQTTISKVFTYTGGSSASVQKMALFDAITSGKMAHEILFAPRTLYPTDQLTIQYFLQVG